MTAVRIIGLAVWKYGRMQIRISRVEMRQCTGFSRCVEIHSVQMRIFCVEI